MSAGIFQGYQFSWEAFYLLVSFGLSAIDFRTFAEKTSVKFVKAAFNVWAENVRREPLPFGKTSTFFLFGLLCFFVGFSKLPPTCPDESFEGFYWNSFSFKFGLERKITELLIIKLYHCSQSSIQKVERIICGKFCFFSWSFCSFIFFWPRGNCFGIFGKKLSTALWEVFSVCLQEIFKSINFLEKHFTC